MLYLTAAKQYPLYGGSFFPVEYRGFWSYPNKIFLVVDVEGFKFVNIRTKEVMASYPYSGLKQVEVDLSEATITLLMIPEAATSAPSFTFHAARSPDIANLIASYSPVHRNWKETGNVGPQNPARRHFTATDRERLDEVGLPLGISAAKGQREVARARVRVCACARACVCDKKSVLLLRWLTMAVPVVSRMCGAPARRWLMRGS